MAIKINNTNVIDNSRQLSVTGVNTLGTVLISSGIVTATTSSGVVTYYGDGSKLDGITAAGLGTALSTDKTNPLNKIYYTNQVLSIGSTTTVDVPSGAVVAYTQYPTIDVESGIDLIIADGDEFIPDILGIGTTGTAGTLGGGGRIRADNFSNRAGTGAPNFNAGLTVTGVVTATGINATGVITATSFVGNGSGLTGVSAGINTSKSVGMLMVFGY